ncbi:hypothetical protein H0H87_009787 [Tephrocybe sp. NHM501043]|nr:hypothetical protein H0H87_009787 [Tephrocybe sp. NHM501043]
MGSSHSVLSTEGVVTLVALAGAAGYAGYTQLAKSPTNTATSETAQTAPTSKKKKSKKQPRTEEAEPAQVAKVAPFPKVIPGGFEGSPESAPEDSQVKKNKKKQKKKGGASSNTDIAASTTSVQSQQSKTAKTTPPAKSPTPITTTPATSTVSAAAPSTYTPTNQTKAKAKPKPKSKPSTPTPPTSSSETRTFPLKSIQSSASIDTDGSWTRVESRRGKHSVGATTSASEAATTEAEHDGEEELQEGDGDRQFHMRASTTEQRRPLAERLLPKPRKTGVDDMLPTSDYPSLARVMRVAPEPVPGFSIEDYDADGDGDFGGDVNGEDDDAGWGVVRGRRKKPRPASSFTSTASSMHAPTKAPELLTKRQR